MKTYHKYKEIKYFLKQISERLLNKQEIPPEEELISFFLNKNTFDQRVIRRYDRLSCADTSDIAYKTSCNCHGFSVCQQ